MGTHKKRSDFFATDDGVAFIQSLKQMAADDTYNTDASYSANSDLYPDNAIPFVDKHIHYLREHPNIDPEHYLANLKLITRIR